MSQQFQHSSDACSGERHQCCLSSAVHVYTRNMQCNSGSNRTVLFEDETTLLGLGFAMSSRSGSRVYALQFSLESTG